MASLVVGVGVVLVWHRWTAVLLLVGGIWILGQLETSIQHVLPNSQQHQKNSLAVCLLQAPKLYDDGLMSGLAKVVQQPDYLNLRTIKIYIPQSVLDPTRFQPGDCLSGVIRLRLPLGKIIPGVFNADRFYFANKIDGIGTVTSLTELWSDNDPAQRLYNKRAPNFTNDDALQLWAALTLGWSSAMSSDLKALISANQLMHLFVISGMHLGLIALMVGFLVQGTALCFAKWWIIDFKLKSAAVLVFCLFYVFWLGFPVPAVRAFVMMGVPLLLFVCGLKVDRFRSLALAAIAVTIWQPQCWLALGAWLSFISVAVILIMLKWRLFERFNRVLSIVIFQAIMSVSILPWALVSGFSVNLFSIVTNLILTPLIAFTALPCVALIAISGNKVLIQGFESASSWLLNVLGIIEQWSVTLPFVPLLILLWVGALLAFAFWYRGVQGLLGGFVGLLSVLLIAAQSTLGVTKQPKTRMTVFDVGHGTSVLLETQQHKILFDTGGYFSENVSLMEASLSRVLPTLDAIVVSHSDADHASGFQYLIEKQPGLLSWSGQPAEVGVPGQVANCHHEQIPFETLRFIPVPDALWQSDNDSSCILVFNDGQHSAILTGDAGKTVEYYLLQAHPELLPVNVLMLGHHGSASSSAQDWLAAQAGQLYTVSSGDRAAPRWPAQRVKDWFFSQGETLLNTAEVGTIQLTFEADSISVKTWDSAYRIRLIN
ncbi:ComEC/Rec2 family competence protein [Reinekea sp. G2M2-21]|uniref:ComEC/Rec2 family competence protein n=1 Tax=Reinekea sp. G2M2-21 TaxID=2788942 RepID=UPI0018AB0611